MKRLLAAALFVLLACHQKASGPYYFTPVAPYSRTFVGAEGGQDRRDYFLVEHPNLDDPAFRKALRSFVDTHSKTVDVAKFQYFGVYVFEKTDGLVETLRALGGLNEGAAKQWVVAGASWYNGKLAEYHLVEDGDTVYDMKGDGPIEPRWRNDFDY